MGVALEELRETVARMERRLSSIDDESARELMAAYEALRARFAADLGDERDELLSRGGALMLAQEALIARQEPRPPRWP
jgi:hypothetical protein